MVVFSMNITSSHREYSQCRVRLDYNFSLCETGQHLINELRKDRNAPREVKSFMIRAIYKKIYPYRKRVQVTIYPWGIDEYRIWKIVIDSLNKKCNGCGRKAYYIIYNMKYLPNWGWRLCHRCINDATRYIIGEYYFSS